MGRRARGWWGSCEAAAVVQAALDLDPGVDAGQQLLVAVGDKGF